MVINLPLFFILNLLFLIYLLLSETIVMSLIYVLPVHFKNISCKHASVKKSFIFIGSILYILFSNLLLLLNIEIYLW